MLQRVGATILWPFRRFFDPRFRGVGAVVEAKHEDLVVRIDLLNRRLDTLFAEAVASQLNEFRSLLAAAIDTTNESNIVIGRTLAELHALSEEIAEAVQRLTDVDQA